MCTSVDVNAVDQLLVKDVQQFQGQSLLLVLGPTGAGKSTYLNYLAAVEMEEIRNADLLTRLNVDPDDVRDRRAIAVKQGKTPVATIGHCNRLSETTIPTVVTTLDGMQVCDTAGFQDTKGMEKRMANAVNIWSVAHVAREVRIVFVMDSSSCDNNRGTEAMRLMNTLTAFFGDLQTMLQYQQSIVVVVSRCKLLPSRDETTLQREFLFWPNVVFYDPLDRPLAFTPSVSSRLEMITKIKQMKPIPNPAEVFLTGLDFEEELILIKSLKQMKDVFDEHLSKEEELEAEKVITTVETFYRILEHNDVQDIVTDLRRELTLWQKKRDELRLEREEREKREAEQREKIQMCHVNENELRQKIQEDAAKADDLRKVLVEKEDNEKRLQTQLKEREMRAQQMRYEVESSQTEIDKLRMAITNGETNMRNLQMRLTERERNEQSLRLNEV